MSRSKILINQIKPKILALYEFMKFNFSGIVKTKIHFLKNLCEKFPENEKNEVIFAKIVQNFRENWKFHFHFNAGQKKS